VLRSAGAVLVGYGLVALAFTWPLAQHLTTAIPGAGADGWFGAWNLWWFDTAVSQGHNPFHTDLLYHPAGTDLYLQTLMPLDGLLVLPVQLAWGPVVAYNVAVLLALTLSAAVAYGLARDQLTRVGARWPGWRGEVPPLAAGLLFGFSPYMADHLLGHLNLLSAAGLPGAVLALSRAAAPLTGDPGGGRALPWRAILAASGALVFTMLCELQYVLFLAVATLLWSAGALVRRQGRALRGPALAWLLFLGVSSPLAVGAARQAAATPQATYAADLAGFSADLLAYVIPSPFHPWWGAWAAGQLERLPGGLLEKVMFPTYTGLLLAGVGLVAGHRRDWPVGGWAAGAGAAGVLSLGPWLHVGGVQWPVPLPAALLYRLPGVDLTRVPGRWVVLVILALAVLAAFGLAALLTPRPPSLAAKGERHHAWGQGAMAGLALGLLGCELCPAPYPLLFWAVPAGLTQLATLPADAGVFHVPIRPYDSTNLRFQLVHGHPILGGYVSRPPAYPLFEGVPLFTQLKVHQDIFDPCAPALEGLGPGLFAYFKTGALVLDKDLLSPARQVFDRRLAQRAGLGPPVYEDAQLVIYRPPAAAAAPPWRIST
jgi:hypothetical protein